MEIFNLRGDNNVQRIVAISMRFDIPILSRFDACLWRAIV